MFVRLRRGETQQNFNIWVYGDKELSRGSGLYVPESGLSKNHHFLLPHDGAFFQFSAGSYTLEVFVIEVGSSHARKLYILNLEVSSEIAKELMNASCGLYFDWGPDSARYAAHVRQTPRSELPPFLQEMFTDTTLEETKAGD
jgi:hypothetical protein